MQRELFTLKRCGIFSAAFLLLAGCDRAALVKSEMAQLRPPVERLIPKAPPLSRPETGDFKAPAAASAPRTYDQIIALPDDQFDIAEAVLSLAAEANPDKTLPQWKATLDAIDELAKKAKEDLPNTPDAQDYFETFYHVVLNKKQTETFREDRAQNYDLSFVTQAATQRRNGSCLSVGILTLAVARRIGAPIFGAQCPGHFFLRYVGPDARGRTVAMNFDVTRFTPDNWAKLDDNFYRRWRPYSSKAEIAGGYLRALTDREVLASFLASRCGYFSTQKKFDLALKDAERALKLNPNSVTAYINGGFALEQSGKLPEAQEYYLKALEIDSHSVRALNNLAYLEIRDPQSPVYNPKRAYEHILAAISHEPALPYLHATEGEVLLARGKLREATKAMQKAFEMEKENKAYHDRFMAMRDQLRAKEQKNSK